MIAVLWRWFAVFAILFSGNIAIYLFLFWQIGNAANKVIWGWKFSSLWTFWWGYLLVSTPLLWLANYGFLSGYFLGMGWFHRIWAVQLTNNAASLLAMLLMSWFWFGELPAKGVLVGLIFFIIGSLISVFWK